MKKLLPLLALVAALPLAAQDLTGASAPDLFIAMQQRPGLKIESTKAPADVLVLDRVEKPSANSI